MPAWSRGRVVLAGDAASCLSLFGGGSSLAIAGALLVPGTRATFAARDTAVRLIGAA
jgi:2-polyprenyl-6-methoxyphenol hydroxylase-like FAD-dependent oxidoreductase